MFIEFDSNSLEEWNSLSEEQQKQAIAEDEVQIAVNVDIKIESHQKVSEEHKYYQATTYGRLINDITISSITEEETVLSIKTFKSNSDSESISIKTDDEKVVEVGNSPYTSIYRIKVSNIKYGQVVEL